MGMKNKLRIYRRTHFGWTAKQQKEQSSTEGMAAPWGRERGITHAIHTYTKRSSKGHCKVPVFHFFISETKLHQDYSL